MGRNIFLSVLTLIAGVCIGVLCVLTFVEPAPQIQPPEPSLTLSAPPAVPTPSASAIPVQSPVTSAPLPLDTEDNRILLRAAFDVAAALKNQDYQTLSTFVHPTDGVIFTPYSTVDPKANLRFYPTQIANLGNDTSKYLWGISDGKGEALELTAAEYFARYVYNADYLQAPMLGVDQIIGSGNALENVSEVFPDSRFVEFYFPGITPEYNGFDWCGLKLVFTEYKNEYKLSAIIHSEWTI